MKCLCTVVEADPAVLARNDIKSCVKVGLTDKSISVREAAIDLIGRYIVQKQPLILQYYGADKQAKIDLRKQLAEELGLNLNTLRLRALRIREGLQKCIENCRDE